jgi:DNA-directed RNA polymerase subunit E'/Rpb7
MFQLAVITDTIKVPPASFSRDQLEVRLLLGCESTDSEQSIARVACTHPPIPPPFIRS